MGTEQHQPDVMIDKTLAALKGAAPPKGMEARIAARLATQPAPLPSGRNFVTAPALTAAWWRGAATGAAFALLAVAPVLLLQHKTPLRDHAAAAGNSPSLAAIPVKISGASAAPCAHPAVLRSLHPPQGPSPAFLLAEVDTESAAPSRPAPVMPLTPQERALARLARTTDPRQLIALSSETEAEDAAELRKSSTPSSDHPAPEPLANPDPAPAATPESAPTSAPEAAPEPPSISPEPSPSANQ